MKTLKTPDYEIEQLDPYSRRQLRVRASSGETFIVKVSGDHGDHSLNDIELQYYVHLHMERRETTRRIIGAVGFGWVHKTQVPANPPAIAVALIQLLSPKRSGESMLGDMQEIFEGEKARFGVERAKWQYWNRAAREVSPLIWHRLKRLGLIALVIDYCRQNSVSDLVIWRCWK